jgi:hypothetical protein
MIMRKNDREAVARLAAANPVSQAALGQLNEARPKLEDLLVAADSGSVDQGAHPGRRRVIGLALAVAIAASLLVPTLALSGRLRDLFTGDPVTSDQLSPRDLHTVGAMASGVSPRVPASAEKDLESFDSASLRRLAVRDGHAYFAALRQGGGLCVSIGAAGSQAVLGSISCSPDFPSEARPVLDESTFGRFTDGGPTLVRLEGFAADGVDKVGVVTTDGTLAVLASVVDNVYTAEQDLPTTGITAIVGLGPGGERVYTMCLAQPCAEG